MDSQKIVAEFNDIKGKFASITLDLLPQNSLLRLSSSAAKLRISLLMADMLHKAIQSMSLEEEEPLTLPDSPRFRVYDENETSLLGRLLNPDCQSMERMIDYMPTAWRVYGRVRGIALSRDRFQFVFQREEDLQTVLDDRPWSYNHWAMVIDRWTANPPENFLQSMELWIRIRHIPVNLFTTDTMFALAKEIGKVEEIAYDPKVSHTKDYIRAKITFNTVTIAYEYEKIHKRCFHCLRLTHEKIRCPMLRKGGANSKIVSPDPKALSLVPVASEKLDGPPGFPVLFPELSKEDRKMALLYISHSNETERKARIQRVQQGIEESKEESSIRLMKITKDLDRGKGHVFSYQEQTEDNLRDEPLSQRSKPRLSFGDKEELARTCESGGFRLGPSSEGRVSGIQGMSKASRRRPSSWKRKAFAKSNAALASTPPMVSTNAGSSKRKPVPLAQTENKALKASDFTVWDRLVMMGLARDEAWILAGDFNELLSNEEKSGGATRSDSSFWDFRNMVQNCKLREIRHTGNCLSWGGWREKVWVQCRLDRSFGNSEWFSLFPKSSMEYLELWASDHRPIRINFALEKEDSRKGRFFFDKRMLSREGFEDMVRLSWAGKTGDRSNTMERIGRCRRRIMNWKKHSDLNSRDKIVRLKGMLETEVSKIKIKNALNQPLLGDGQWHNCPRAIAAVFSITEGKLNFVPASGNFIANMIASSVTRDKRLQSYVARCGPAWLTSQILQEASA
ncbi:hypothetical protein Bca52824_002832 [Brassica carinata]|uniref:DUF4283 domain-containing protein n=1 Tax=Brassica carinata TaxID=52824 RepID=A0A8X7WLK9_BRACI|nr:hypothetical protein Bca52824_002832 [Brassica carinata]